MIDEKIAMHKESTKSSFREANEFMQTFHRDFLDYATK
jgi:hypothetical protein